MSSQLAIPMRSVTIFEQNRYTVDDFVESLDLNDSEAVDLMSRLVQHGLMRAEPPDFSEGDVSDLLRPGLDQAEVYLGAASRGHVLVFVGVAVVNGYVLLCMPKYFTDSSDSIPKFKQVLQVIERLKHKYQNVDYFGALVGDRNVNALSVMLFLLRDYFEFGVYSNSQDMVQVNGPGEVLWDRTIDEKSAVFSLGRPFYPEMITRHRVDDKSDLFRRLHESILTEVSRFLRLSGLSDLFDLSPVNLADSPLEELGDRIDLLTRIRVELNVQFNSRKQLVLKAMYSYISGEALESSMNDFSVFGTRSFNLVWEAVCVRVFADKSRIPVDQLPLGVSLADWVDPSDSLQSIIERPRWHGHDQNGSFAVDAKSSLTPDLISFVPDGASVKVYIFDAKYYRISMSRKGGIGGQPGVADVTKQYLYQLALTDFMDSHGISQFRNCFLIPGDADYVSVVQSVTMDMLGCLGLSDIAVRVLPAERVYSAFLENRLFDIDSLGL